MSRDEGEAGQSPSSHVEEADLTMQLRLLNFGAAQKQNTCYTLKTIILSCKKKGQVVCAAGQMPPIMQGTHIIEWTMTSKAVLPARIQVDSMLSIRKHESEHGLFPLQNSLGV